MIIDFILFFVINTIIAGLFTLIMYVTHIIDIDDNETQGLDQLSGLFYVIIFGFFGIYYFVGLVLIIFQKLFCWDWYVEKMYIFADSVTNYVGIKPILYAIVILVIVYILKIIQEKIEAKKRYSVISNAWNSYESVHKKYKDDIGNFKSELRNNISDIYADMVQATDMEVYDNISLELMDKYTFIKKYAEEKIEDIKTGLKSAFRDYEYAGTGLEELDKGLKNLKRLPDKEQIFKDCFESIVNCGELKVVTKLNTNDDSIRSWDGNLYKTTREDINQDNVMETIIIDEDID